MSFLVHVLQRIRIAEHTGATVCIHVDSKVEGFVYPDYVVLVFQLLLTKLGNVESLPSS